ncbi:MAG: DNA mismatch repair protein MutS [Oscillospiraceae bacterium]|nr:DNA mismatch repair protein MutS [Oscillospiraceae bacterium]
MMKQYLEVKDRAADSILFFRLGDFYEMFGDDARTASKELDLVLTSRDKSSEDPNERIPMCGVPYHSAESYIAKLIAKGYKVAICEQVEDPTTAKGLVARDIVRIVTPGTLMESSMLDEGSSNYLCTVYIGEASAICFADLSTGEISVSEFFTWDLQRIENELGTFQPAEAILGGSHSECASLNDYLSSSLGTLVERSDERFNDSCSQLLKEHFGSDACNELNTAGIYAAGALLSYIIDTQKTDISHLKTLRHNLGGVHMELDINTMKNLELVSSIRTGEKRGSLLWVLDKTKTPMGRRLIRTWVLRPLLQTTAIMRRLSAVSELFNSTVLRSELFLALRNIGDMERVMGKIVYGNAVSRDLRALHGYISILPLLTDMLETMTSSALRECGQMDTLDDVAAQIHTTIKEDPPFSVREGGFINDGVNHEVDHLRFLLENSTAALMEIETKERERTGKKLKIGYNRVFGYYIEIPRSASEDVPNDYLRKQTLANAERFITEELKELEAQLLTAKDDLAALEFKLFEELRINIAKEVGRIQETAWQIAQLDVLCSFAEAAAENNYSMPEIDLSSVIDIRDGRHPVVEAMQRDTLFVPNDTYLDGSDSRMAIITGPNMAGKSTYMRQTAIIVLMAQIGSFVPAKSARIGLVDRIFTRIGASDDLSAGKSTFMVEMTEVADILRNASKSSLLILDEIGRGTSTYDGMSVARAVLEHCADKKKLGAKTLFATHYHELTALENEIDGVKNYNISAKKRGNDIIFLRKIVPGGADDSYGIEVAGLAGVTESVIKRAKAVLDTLENQDGPKSVAAIVKEASKTTQLSMEDMRGSEIAALLKETDLNTLSPIEALNLLYEMKKKL